MLAQRADLKSVDEGVPLALGNWRPNVELSADIEREFNRNNTRLTEGEKGVAGKRARDDGVPKDQNIDARVATIAGRIVRFGATSCGWALGDSSGEDHYGREHQQHLFFVLFSFQL